MTAHTSLASVILFEMQRLETSQNRSLTIVVRVCTPKLMSLSKQQTYSQVYPLDCAVLP